MSNKDHRNGAAYILATAHKAVTAERGPQHGPAQEQFAMAGELWSIYLRNKMARYDTNDLDIDAHDVAMMMDLLKTSRVAWGDASEADHYADKAGYTGLAASIAGVKAPVKEQPVLQTPPPQTPPPQKAPIAPGYPPIPVAKHVINTPPTEAIPLSDDESALAAVASALKQEIK